MDVTVIFTILKALLSALGGLTVVWGFYDMFGDGQQNSTGLKKIVGGIAFIVISIILLAMVEKEIASASTAAGITSSVILRLPW